MGHISVLGLRARADCTLAQYGRSTWLGTLSSSAHDIYPHLRSKCRPHAARCSHLLCTRSMGRACKVCEPGRSAV